MNGLIGARELTRLIVHRDRVRILVWVLSIVALVVVSAASVKGLYPTQADLDQAAAASEGNAGAIAFNGPAQGLDTIGGEVAFQAGAIGLVAVALMSLLMMGRLTRGEEEAGRVELLRSLPVGRDAPTAAASVVVAAMDVAVGVGITSSLLALGLPVAGSVVLGMSFTLVGLFFAGVAMLAAQVTENTRVVYGIAGAVLGAAFLARAIGDIGDGTVSWLSPIGWAQKARPFAGERWWPLLPLVAATAGLVIATGVVAARRDLGGGLVAPRPGPSRAGPGLLRPLGLALRLQRGSVVGWSLMVLSMGVAYGSIGNSVDDFIGDNQAIADMVAHASGATLTESYLSTSFGLTALVGAAFAIQATLRLRSEETALRAEAILVTAISRRQWAISHLAMAFGGSMVVLAVAGLAVGGSYGLVIGDLSVMPRLLEAAIAYAPAVWVLIGLAIALVGWQPRWVVVVWGALALCFVVALLGELLGLPAWVMAISPFDHVPALPAADLSAGPLVVLATVAGGLTWSGLIGLSRRDIG